MLMTSSEQEKHLLIQIQLFQLKAVLVPNVSAKFILFSVIFYTQKSKDEMFHFAAILNFDALYENMLQKINHFSLAYQKSCLEH